MTRKAWVFTLRSQYQSVSPIALEPPEPEVEIVYGETALDAYQTTEFYRDDPDDLSLDAFIVERAPELDEED